MSGYGIKNPQITLSFWHLLILFLIHIAKDEFVDLGLLNCNGYPDRIIKSNTFQIKKETVDRSIAYASRLQTNHFGLNGNVEKNHRNMLP